MRQEIIDMLHYKVKNENTPINQIPIAYQEEVQKLLENDEEEPKKDIILGSSDNTSEIEQALRILGGED